MLIKFFPRGTGRGSGPVDYCLAEVVRETGEVRRPPPELLAGDPALLVQTIDSLSFKQRYTSGVISFAKEDAPSEAQQRELMAEFEAAAFAGLDPERFQRMWVRHTHTDEGRVELHFVVARVDLETGKSFNIAPPGWESTYDPLRDKWNWRHGWARPDDPERARDHQPGHRAAITAAQLRQGLAVEPDPRDLIAEYLRQRIEAGAVNNRAEVLEALQDAGLAITRQGKDYITVSDPESGERYRLKGGIYAERFDRAELERAAASEAGRGRAADRGVDLGKSEAAGERLAAAIQRRAEYNAGRYPQRDRGPQERAIQLGAGLARAEAGAPGRNQREHDPAYLADALAAVAAGRDLPARRGRFVGLDELPAQAGQRGASEAGRRDGGNESGVRAMAAVLPEQGRPGNQGMRGVAVDDRDREAVAGVVQGAVQRVREAGAAFDAACGGLDQAGQALEFRRGVLAGTGAELKRAGARMIENRADELERFKADINLSEYLARDGWKLDKAKSSKAYAVMRNGDEKLVVTKAKEDGHYVYCNTGDVSDSGSVIDYVQKRRGLNLGQVRKELRPWIGAQPPKVDVQAYQREIQPVERDFARCAAAWEAAGQARPDGYAAKRGLSAATLAAYAGSIREDAQGRLLFAHSLPGQSVAGYEAKGEGFTGFAKGGQKGLFWAAQQANVKRVVIAETALDALSVAELEGCRKDTAYVSIGGTMNDTQPEFLKRVLAVKQPAEVALATDRDAAGEKFAQQLAAQAPETAKVTRLAPSEGKDWNDALRLSQAREAAKAAELERQQSGPELSM